MERELKLKYALNVMGCRSVTYWLGTYLFDILFATIGLILFVVMCFALKFSEITEHIGEVFALVYCFIFSLIAYSYLISFLFKSA